MKFLLVLALPVLLYPQTESSMPWGEVPEEEVAVLREFYRATNGDDWKNNTGWLTDSSPCEWYGVVCSFEYVHGPNVSNITMITLLDNNLTGTLPPSLATLPALQVLDVSLNHLEGDVPPGLLERWDKYDFEFRGAKNRFRNMVQRVRLVADATAVLCAEDDDVRFRLDAEEYGPARFESVRCDPETERGTRCLVREGNGPYLERLTRALNRLGYRNFDSEYWHPFTGATHQAFITTTVWWGDGSEKTVETYGRQGPIEVWMAQQVILGLLSDMYWKSERFEATCPSRVEGVH